MNNIQMGLEYELQLMAETKEGLKVVSAEIYLANKLSSYTSHNILPQCCKFDYGNIEIATPTRDSYKEAVESANYILCEKLVPALINDFKLEKFALFLPTPMCRFYYDEEPDYYTWRGRRICKGSKIRIIRTIEDVCCLKHLNISLNYDSNTNVVLNHIKNGSFDYDAYAKEITKDWVYDYNSLIKKGYSVLLKDLEFKDKSRVHIKIPYHYAPSNGNPNLLPNFEDILLPPERGWKNILVYYKNGTLTRVRNLI